MNMEEKSKKEEVRNNGKTRKPFNKKRYKVICKCCGYQGHRKEQFYHKTKKCNTCNKIGHLIKVFSREKSKNEEERTIEEESEFVGFTDTQQQWLSDTGSLVHVTHHKEDLHDVTECDYQVKVGGGITIKATMKGNVTIQMNYNVIKLKYVLYVPNFAKRIISVG